VVAPANHTTAQRRYLTSHGFYYPKKLTRTQMLNAELTIVRPRVYVFLVDNLSAEVVHGVFDVWTKDNTGEPSFRGKRNRGVSWSLLRVGHFLARARQLTS